MEDERGCNLHRWPTASCSTRYNGGGEMGSGGGGRKKKQRKKKCSVEIQVAVIVILCITAEGFEDKYLGLPVPQVRMKAGNFNQQKKKISRFY